MMKIEQLFLFFVLGVAFISCGDGKKENDRDEVAEKKEEVIAIHDEVMPKMGQLKSYQNQLGTKADGLEAQAAEPLRQAARKCDEAYEGMFVWMRQFDAALAGMSEEEALAYLEEQREKVMVVNEDIKNALREAEMLLEEE
jgi:hypothetical protein